MRRLLTGVVAGALALGAIPNSTSADPLDPVVEGTGAFWAIGVPDSNSTQILWGCEAHADGPVAATGVDCTLRLDGVVIDTRSQALSGAVVATGAVTPARYGTLEVWWEAQAYLLDGSGPVTDSGCVP